MKIGKNGKLEILFLTSKRSRKKDDYCAYGLYLIPCFILDYSRNEMYDTPKIIALSIHFLLWGIYISYTKEQHYSDLLK